MKKLIYILLLLILLSLSACNNKHYNIESDVPELKISSDNEDIKVEKGTHKWTVKEGYFSSKTIVKDTDSAEKIAASMEGNHILPKTKLNLIFSKEPNNVEVIPWGGLKSEDYEFTGKEIVAPDKEGIYVFEILGEWKQGKVSYIIKIIIGDPNF